MAVAGFYNENSGRAYPFVQDVPLAMKYPFGPHGQQFAVFLPRATIVDFGCTLGPGTAYDATARKIFLKSIARAGSTFTFAFRSTAPALAGWALVFTRTLSDPEYAVEETEAVNDDDEVPGGCGDDFFWNGYLVTGQLDDLADNLPDGKTMTADDGIVQVEPALVEDLDRGYVRSINLVNGPRTMVGPPEGCSEESSAAQSEDNNIVVSQICMTGALLLKEGYSISIRQSDGDSAFTLAARVGAGAGAACGEVPRFPAALVGHSKAMQVAGGGFTIRPDPDDAHALIVDADLNDLAVCPDSYESSQIL